MGVEGTRERILEEKTGTGGALGGQGRNIGQ